MTELQELVDAKTIRLAKEDPAVIIENLFSIANRGGKVVDFRLNPAQLEYYKNRSARDDILKARKEGFSSLILAILTVKFLFLENVNCACISHEDEATKRLFEKVEFYIDTLSNNGSPIEVKLFRKSGKHIKYHFERNGKMVRNTFFIGTAGSKAFGRGDTIHFLHASEVAFWENPGRLLTGLLNSVPDDFDNTYIVKESTANGSGTMQHLEWEKEKAGKSLFRPHFFGWHKDPANRKTLRQYEKQMKKRFVPVLEDERLMAKYALDMEQVIWRRMKISSMQTDSKEGYQFTKEELFKQEFPIEDREAFLTTGKSMFDKKSLEWYEDVRVGKPSHVGDLEGYNPPVWVANSNGTIKVWEMPQADRGYVIGADVAEGGDFSYATVLCKETNEQVAEVNVHMDEFEFAALLYKLGMFYNGALIGPERNNQGVAVVKKLDELNYMNLYVQQSIDEITKRTYNKVGWRTDSKTRPIMLGELNSQVALRKFGIRSQLVIDQMYTFIRGKTKPQAMKGTHDDAVIGNAIALQLLKLVTAGGLSDSIQVRDYTPNTSFKFFSKKR